MASVSIKGVEKAYGSVQVIHGVDVEARDGEFVVLVGPSGCGKSTLLRMIAGLEDISSGEIWIGDRIVNYVPPKDRDIAMVFQSYALYPHMTVRQNMEFALHLRKAPSEITNSRIAKAAEILNLEKLLKRRPGQLSGGQRQRVAMGRAIVREPKVFLFDEPLSNLDAKLRVQMRAEIRELHQRLKTTCIYVTHDQIEAMTMADRIVVMHDGVVEQEGRPLELYDRPANMFVAGFLGSPSMNFLEGTVVGGERAAFRTKDGIDIPIGATPNGFSGKPAICGIRPESFALSPEASLPATVSVVEPTGSETQVFARLGEAHVIVTLRERIDRLPGTPLRLKVEPRAIHLFDPTTQARLN
jgi:multiple sugar transport system ATP-binding protein